MVRRNFKDRNPDLVKFLNERIDAYNNGEEKPILYTETFLKEGLLINFPSKIYNLGKLSFWENAEPDPIKKEIIRKGISRIISSALDKLLKIEEQEMLRNEETVGKQETPAKNLLMWKFTQVIREDGWYGWTHINAWNERDFEVNAKRQQGAVNHTNKLREKIKG